MGRVRPRNDAWALYFDLAGTMPWHRIFPLGFPPGGRAGHTAVYDPVRGRMVVFGGYDNSSVFNDVWALSLAGSPAWTPVVVAPA